MTAYRESEMDIDRPKDEIRDHPGLDEDDSRHALSRRALLAGGAGVAGLVAGAGLLGLNQAVSSADGLPTNNTNPSDAFLQFFLPVGGAELPVGEVVDKEYPHWIRVPTFSFGAENPVTIGSGTSGAGAGKAKFDKFVITKPVDNTSPQLYRAMVTGGHFREMKLALRLGDGPGSGKTYLMFLFGYVFVENIQWSGGVGSVAEEEVTFMYGQLAVQYRIVKPDGSLGSPNQVTWDQTTNNSWTPPLP